MNDKQSGRTDQQETNKALAALAAAGNTFALGQLWEVNKSFIRQQLWQWYEKNKPVADSAGLSFEDLVQEGYFAVEYAAKHYSAEQGCFTTYLGYALLHQIQKITTGEHRRIITTEDGRRAELSADPLNSCISLDEHLDGEDEGSGTRGELISDPAAEIAFRAVDDDSYTQELHKALEKAIDTNLTDKQASVIRKHYFEGKDFSQIAQENGISANAAKQTESQTLRKLQYKACYLRRWHDEIISTRAWQGTGWNAWNCGGSVEERTVEHLEQWEEYGKTHYRVE